ncbi:long-chain acyl-CoA synthetase [Motilibacter rhizosphaerae]|uniref:Acyl-CoA synthetase n=1 Tax=Motilibacter rhizosphaerae TaxID=598652 RepID=A0A4Q7NR51_9ACTN|nr:AMP-dependent synthetase/ligase [Motilibacter rhizosphaerae]RZS89536.1 long-chain acyl-CoA synthetase [Motilibacter rhizosphaerae]
MQDFGGSLTGIVWDRAARDPGFAMLSRRTGTAWSDVSAAAFRDEVVALAKGFVATGLQPGERVALMSRTRYEWALIDFAVWAAGGVVVPVYETSSAEQVGWILQDSGASVVVVETAEHAATYDAVAGSLPTVRDVWRIEPAGEQGSLDDLRACGTGVAGADVEARRTAVHRDDLATVIYTSGTTGRPKGCELTHGNFLAEVEGILEGVHEVFGKPDAAALLFLPLAHVLARVFQLAVLAGGVRLGHTADVKNLLADMEGFRPTFLLAVPRVFEKVYNASEQKAEAAGKGRVFRLAADTAVAWSEARDTGHAGPFLRAKHRVFDRLVYGKMREALGGRVEFAVCGGAPLSERLGHFFRGIGLTVLVGYGLTETTAAACVNTPSRTRMGTVGPPLPGVEVRTDADGEIQVRGGIVFRGYAGDDVATKQAFTDDGWFRTGDLGHVDADGFLHITGRSKDILVTAGGKNVVPATLEDVIREHPLVSQCVVVGDGRPFVGALVTLDEEALPAWFETRRRPALPLAEAVRDPQVLAGVQAAVDAANVHVSRAESVRRFRVLDVDFTEDSGHLTPSMKVKRKEVMRDFAAEVDALYS